MVRGEKVESLQGRISQGVRAAQLGLLVNAALAVVKVLTGLLGNSYALIADGVESGADIFSSLFQRLTVHAFLCNDPYTPS